MSGAADWRWRRPRSRSTAAGWNGGTPKSNERRSAPLPAFLAAELDAAVRGRSGEELVFTSPLGTVLRNRNARSQWLDTAATAIGEPGLTPHEPLHTAASMAISAGANVKAVQRMLGHAPPP